jgi:hypothetical protein
MRSTIRGSKRFQKQIAAGRIPSRDKRMLFPAEQGCLPIIAQSVTGLTLWAAEETQLAQ